MRVAIIGRTGILFNCIQYLLNTGHTIPLIITSKAAPDYSVKETDFQKIANEIGARYIFTPRINDKSIIDNIKSLGEIDVAISINYTGVISSDIINLFTYGILNAHGGNLPRYRGNACQAWAIINGENEIGLCIHKMIGGELDSGDILEKRIYPIGINTRIGEVYEWFEKDVPELMMSSLNKLAFDRDFCPEVQSNNPEDILRCYPRLPEDGKIEWNLSAVQILRLINASSEPYSGAFTYYSKFKIIIWRASLFDFHEKYLAVPGQIAFINKQFNSNAASASAGLLMMLKFTTIS